MQSSSSPPSSSSSSSASKSLSSTHKTATIAALDVSSALISSFCVAPFITLIDRSIFENASGKRSMTESVKFGLKELFTRPHVAVSRLEFRYIWGVYGGTYVVANNVESYCKASNINPELPKFLTVSATNMGLSVLKDKAFTKMFGTSAPKSLPLLSYLLFFSRDSLTIAASFNAPNYIAKKLQERNWGPNESKILAQLTAPCAIQLVSAPLHLLALDLYNRPNAKLIERFQFIKKEYSKTALARISRIFPAFGICGVGNTYLKEYLKDGFGVSSKKSNY